MVRAQVEHTSQSCQVGTDPQVRAGRDRPGALLFELFREHLWSVWCEVTGKTPIYLVHTN